MPNGLGSLNNKSLRERVVEALREAILNGELKPGESLVETELAAQLGISRAPLREALQQLAAEGLIEVVPYHGARVRSLTRQDIEELYSLRMVLETFAARRLIEQDDPAAFATLRACFNAMLQAAEQEDIARLSAIDRDFHDALIDLSKHTLLRTTWNTVSMRVRQVMGLRNRRNSDMKGIAYNHLPIIEALERGDEAAATALLETHIASARDLLVEQWDVPLAEANGTQEPQS